ncbi:MAG: hypothetical protein B7Z26_09525 [Asticcacaulis sp. 32-58-5]|nr:MAG: hypothetical protein B7Z26_09525 [Asticcacaulis sp. 32-58-5]
MAKAIFHRRQRVWVEPVGTWALIDKVNPIWAKGFDEPIRVTYDCGLGREFRAEELAREAFRLAAAKLSVTTTFVTRTVR